MATSRADDRERWERNERVRQLVLERDRERPPNELLAQAIELSRFAMKLRASARESRGS